MNGEPFRLQFSRRFPYDIRLIYLWTKPSHANITQITLSDLLSVNDSFSTDQGESDDANYYSEEIICEVSDEKSRLDSFPDENGPTFPGFTRLRFGRIAKDFRPRL